MRMAYLILAHDDIRQLDLLVTRLLAPGTPDIVIIHADRRSALWQELRQRPADATGRLHLIDNSVAVRWGHMSQVTAMARLVRAAAAVGCDYAHLISGVDWPAIPREDLVRQLAETGTAGKPQCYIEAQRGLHDWRMQIFRFDTPWLRADPRRNRLAYAASWEMRRVGRWLDSARRTVGAHRSLPYGTWHYGSSWWTLPADAIELLDHELAQLLGSTRLWGTVCSDEHVVPSIIAKAYPDRLAPPHRFIVFPAGDSSPRLLNRDDQQAIAASDAWFVRKVSAAHDPFFMELPVDQTPAPAHPSQPLR